MSEKNQSLLSDEDLEYRNACRKGDDILFWVIVVFSSFIGFLIGLRVRLP
jgi:hypothetical protein